MNPFPSKLFEIPEPPQNEEILYSTKAFLTSSKHL
jgi:hypothetical protein